MKLVTFERHGRPPDGKRRSWGVLVGADVYELADKQPASGEPPFPSTMLEFLQAGDPAWEAARRVADAIGAGRGHGFVAEDTISFLPPVPNPPSFLDFYVFEEHVRNARARRGLSVPPEWYRYPAYYNSNPHTLIGNEQKVYFPAGETKMDYELELGAILRRGGRHLTEEEAAACIAGYTIVNDWSARALQREVMAIGLGPAPAKDFGTSVGCFLTTAEEIPADRWAAPGHPALEMVALVHGEEWSRGNSGDAHFTFPQMIAFASRFRALYPGDLIGSGTVGTGCGLEQDRFLRIGDRVDLYLHVPGRPVALDRLSGFVAQDEVTC